MSLKFNILNRFSGAVQFTAEIDCDESETTSVKIGLAVKWGLKSGADLYGANLRGADLRGADLYGANLRGADLYGADLYGAFDLRYVKAINCELYTISYTAETMQIGCERHTLAEWWGFDDDRIEEMDGEEALKWWKKWKPIIKQIVEISPAEPTGYTEKKEAA